MIEIVTTGGQDHPVRGNSLASGTGEANINQILGVKQILE